MGKDSHAVAPGRYRAFISYSHADARFAGWLHRKLEAWALSGHDRLSPIFIDRAELAAGPDLSAQVRAALAQSAALIVVASPAARTSRWVAQEISLFRELQPDRPILAALIDGEPLAAFPDPLLRRGGAALEPLAADFRDGHDGKRLALLKIVAGLTGLPLDRLVQRDGQRRQRRVMAVTAGAVVLSLVLAAALIAALRARTEAEHQRAEAEGMVEFMLTDLRDKLKGVGRLDIMDAVNARAMAHYAGERDLESLPSTILARRAKLLQAMAEDDLDAAATRERGRAEASAAGRLSANLLASDPANPDWIFLHAQSEYFIGYANFVPVSTLDAARVERAGGHWQAYRALAEQLARIEPNSQRGQREIGYAQDNLYALALHSPDQRAMNPAKICHEAERAFAAYAATRPDDLSVQVDLANHLGWEADAFDHTNQQAQALALRRRQYLLAGQLVSRWPGDARTQQAAVQAGLGLTRALLASGLRAEAGTLARETAARANQLSKRDPANAYWAGLVRESTTISTQPKPERN